MKNYYRASSKISPEIIFKVDGNFEISGNSYMEDPNTFYDPLFNWTNNFLEKKDTNITLTISLIYINSSSSKQILNLIILLKSNTKNINIIWLHEAEDSDILELGESLEKLTKIKFKFKSYNA